MTNLKRPHHEDHCSVEPFVGPGRGRGERVVLSTIPYIRELEKYLDSLEARIASLEARGRHYLGEVDGQAVPPPHSYPRVDARGRPFGEQL